MPVGTFTHAAVSFDPALKSSHRRPDIYVESPGKVEHPQSTNREAPLPSKIENEKIGSPVFRFRLDIFPRNFEEPWITIEAEIRSPVHRNWDNLDPVANREEGMGKSRICMIIGHEDAGVRPVNNKKNGTEGATVSKGRQFSQMSRASLSHGIWKHGHTFSKKRAGFYLEKNSFRPSLQEEVKAASTGLDFRRFDSSSLETGNLSMLEKVAGHVIGPMGVEHYG